MARCRLFALALAVLLAAPWLGQGRGLAQSGGSLDLVGRLLITDGVPQHLVVSGQYAFLAEASARGTDGAVRVVDVSDPSTPRTVARYGLGPIEYADLALAGQYLYVVARGGGLWVLDVSTPTSPRQVGSLLFYTESSEHVAPRIALAGGIAYVSGGGWGLYVVDVSDPAHPILRATLDRSDQPYYPERYVNYTQPVARGNRVYVGEANYHAGNRGSMDVVDVSDPSKPREVAVYLAPVGQTLPVSRTTTPVFSVALQERYAYLATGYGGLRVVDVSTDQPIEVGALPFKIAYDVAVAGRYAYVAATYDQAGLHLIDVSDPTRPTEVGFYRSPGAVAIANGLIYLAVAIAGAPAAPGSEPALVILRQSEASPSVPAPCAGCDRIYVPIGPRTAPA